MTSTSENKDTEQVSQPKSAYSEMRLNKKVTNLSRLVVALFIIIVLNSFFLIYLNLPKPETNLVNNLKTENIKVPVQPISLDQDEKEITQFVNNSAIADIGFILSIQKESISTNNSSNCRTPIPPPVNNGCYFSVLPYSLGIPSKGTIIKSMSVSGEITKDAEIQVYLKDYDKGELKDKIHTITKNELNKPLLLPSIFSQKMGLYFTLWSKSGDITVSKIGLKFASVDSLKQVSGVVKNQEIAKLNDAVVYADIDEDEKLSTIDTLWSSKSTFPGIQAVNIDAEGNFKLLRDETNFEGIKPDSWSGDDNKKSIPAGKWLLVSTDKTIVYSFVVHSENEVQTVDLKKVS